MTCPYQYMVRKVPKAGQVFSGNYGNTVFFLMQGMLIIGSGNMTYPY